MEVGLCGALTGFFGPGSRVFFRRGMVVEDGELTREVRGEGKS